VVTSRPRLSIGPRHSIREAVRDDLSRIAVGARPTSAERWSATCLWLLAWPVSSFVEPITTSPVARTALVVEDARDVRELFARVLQDGGYRVECAETVREALGLLRTRPGVDVVVADYKLVDGTGTELIHQASNEGYLDVNLTATLICTAYRYVELPPHVTIVHKPIDPHGLLQAIERARGRSHLG
jgi:CheY-like chemotaxis protein